MSFSFRKPTAVVASQVRVCSSFGPSMISLAVATAALTLEFTAAAFGQVPSVLSGGPPVQVTPYVTEPGVPSITITPGTSNPFAGADGSGGTGSGGGAGGGSAGDSDALNTLLGTSWGGAAVSNADSLGVNASALAGMCVVESGCNANIGANGSYFGAFQMGTAAFQDGLKTALAADPSLASQIVQGAAGMTDPTTQAIAASGYLLQANTAMENAGISNPTTLDARAYYNFGPTYGVYVAQAQPTATMSSILPASYLAGNGISSTETVAQWQAAVSAKMGTAAGQTILS